MTAANTSIIRAALEATQANSADTKILEIGDSTTATGVDSATGLRSTSRPTQLGPKLATLLGVPVNINNVFGSAGKTDAAGYEAMNPKLVFNTGIVHATNTTAGGRVLSHNAITGATRYTPGGTFNRFRLRFSYPAITRGLVWLTSTGATGTVTGGTQFLATTIDESAGAGATWVEVRSMTTAAVTWCSLETYDDADKQVFLNNAGWNGSDSADWTTASFGAMNPLGSIGEIAPHLGIINLVINAFTAGISVSTHMTQLQTIIDKVRLTGNAVLCIPNPLGTPDYGSEAVQAPRYDMVRALAATNGIPLLDFKTTLGTTRLVGEAAGWLYTGDEAHVTELGNDVLSTYENSFFETLMAA